MAMDPSTFAMLKSIDLMLDAVLPNPGEFKDLPQLWTFYQTINPAALADIGIAVVTQMVKTKVGLP